MRAQVRSPRAEWCVVRGAWCVFASVLHATRNTQHATASPRLAPATRSRAFTLIEIMIVVAIMGIVMAMSVPIVYKVWRKAPMREAVKDIVEVCSHARARAIMQGTGYRGGLSSQGEPPGVGRRRQPVAPRPADRRRGACRVRRQRPGPACRRSFPTRSSSRRWMSTCRAWSSTTRSQVRIRFYPNGISDEMRMILFDGRDRMGIELEITTGLANVVPDPLREWIRR